MTRGGWMGAGLTAALAALAAMASCGGSTNELDPTGGGAGMGVGGSGGGLIACDPPCQAPQFCSVTGQCLEPGHCNADADCAPGTECDMEYGLCAPGGECGTQEFPTTALPPNLLIVLDRTGSMGAEVPDSGGKSRWQVAGEAIAAVLQDYADRINFGLNVFSACLGGGCAPGTIVQPIGTDATTINQTISQTSLCNSGDPETVIGGTLQALVGEPSLQVAGRDNAILLLTDGHDNCGGGGAQAAAVLLGQTVPVEVYVVGFSGGVNATELQAIAEAAGTDPYYQADDATQLNAALQAIAGSVATCTFALSEPPDGDLYIFFNDDPAGIPQDSTNGWSYDPATNTITFHGDACDAIKSGDVTDIDVVFGCPMPVPD